MKSRSRTMAEKSVDAMLVAIEIYNKPDFRYREEVFSILSINAWELLLKARILQLDGNRISSLLVYEKRKNADGTTSVKKYRKFSRSGNPLTIGLFQALDRLANDYGETIPPTIRTNLELICEIRDSAVHSVNNSFELARIVQELGTACIRNFLALIREWFAIDLSVYNFFLMPLAFVSSGSTAKLIDTNKEQRKLVEYLSSEVKDNAKNNTDDYTVALELDVKFMRSRNASAQRVVVTNDPSATPITLTEENIRDRYPLNYKSLTARLAARYSNFSQNAEYHAIRQNLESESKYCHQRFLDQEVKEGIGKKYYSTAIVGEFDKHYERKA